MRRCREAGPEGQEGQEGEASAAERQVGKAGEKEGERKRLRAVIVEALSLLDRVQESDEPALMQLGRCMERLAKAKAASVGQPRIKSEVKSEGQPRIKSEAKKKRKRVAAEEAPTRRHSLAASPLETEWHVQEVSSKEWCGRADSAAVPKRDGDCGGCVASVACTLAGSSRSQR